MRNGGETKKQQITELAALQKRVAELEQREQERAECESELARTRAMLDDLLERLPDAIVVVDRQGSIVRVNGQAEKMFGYSRQELVGQRHDILVPDDVREKHHDFMKDFISAPRARNMGTGMELRGRKKDGAVFPVDISLGFQEMDGSVLVLAMVRDFTEHMRTKEALAESEERYRKLVELAPDGVAIQSEGKLVFLNSTGAKVLGAKSPEELIGKSVFDFVHRDYREIVKERLRLMTEEQKAVPLIEEKFVRLDGTVMVGEVTSIPFTYRGKPATQTWFRDITWRKQAEAALRESEERYRKLVELAPDGILVQSEGIISFVNASAAKSLGADSPAQIIGRSIWDLVHPDYRQVVEGRIGTMTETGAPAPLIEERFLRFDGSSIVVEVAATPFTWRGKPAVEVWFRDISGRKQMEDALRESEERYRTLVELSPDGIAIHSEGKIIFANQTTAGLVGAKSPEELIGKPIWDFVDPHYRTIAAERIKAVIEKKKLVPFIEEVFLRLDGTPYVAEVASTVFTHRGKLAIQTWIRDVTWRKKAAEEVKQAMADLERSNKELEQFAYAVSHDLREPLRVVTNFTQLLERRYKGKLDKDADEFITVVVDGAARMDKMIDDLLEYSRVGTRGQAFGPTDCEAALEQALANLKGAIEESKAVVSHDPLPTVTGDASQIARLLQNLISNAIKFRRQKAPRVHIAAKKEWNEWIFSVRDDGIGIAKEDFPRLFQVFSRLHGRGEYPGTGVGLAICKRIVGRHGGRIWVQSQAGKGSTFYFTIPVTR